MTLLAPEKKYSLSQNHLISISDLSKEEMELVLDVANDFKKERPQDLLKGKILASCFFEPSTRTRLSFESAMLQLGGAFIGFSSSDSTSSTKGESLFDTMKVISAYADLIVIRHPLEGSARLSSQASTKPVINAGDGANQHPTQTLADLFAIKKWHPAIEELHIVLAGDLKFGRTVHSLSLALAHYGARLYFVSDESLSLPESIQHELRKKGVRFSFHTSLEEVLYKADILYMTRIQKERFENKQLGSSNIQIKKEDLKQAKAHLKILHPLPRNEEIEKKIDETPFAAYFDQASDAIYVRMAILALLSGKL